jgi:hypothetical protein
MYTAIIVEPRKHAALPFVLNNFLENLSDDWNVIIFHGNLNLEYINEIIDSELEKYRQRISLINLNIDNLTRDDYNNLFMRNKEFYNNIPTETFLLFQTDTMIFSKYKNIINNFLEYDYVGAPWNHSPTPRNSDERVGNGGLSLRKKSKMLEIMDVETDFNCPEDVFFSCSDLVKLYKPSKNKAKLFSIENVFSYVTFGCHQPWVLLKYCPIMLQYYPEVRLLKELQYVIE